MSISVKCYCRAFTTENFGECFYIHSALDGASGEGMSQGVEIEFANSRALGEFFEHVLVPQNCHTGISTQQYHRRLRKSKPFSKINQLFLCAFSLVYCGANPDT